MNPMHTSRWERTYMWPFLETRRFFTALGRHWKRIVIGAFAGWLAAVVLVAVALVLLERGGVVTRSTSDMLGIAVVLGGTALGALAAYAIRPRHEADRRGDEARVQHAPVGRAVFIPLLDATHRPPASTRPPHEREVPRPRGIGEEPQRRRRSRAADR